MKKKLLLLIPIVFMLGLNLFLNTEKGMGLSPQQETAPATAAVSTPVPSPTASAKPSPTATPRPTPEAEPTPDPEEIHRQRIRSISQEIADYALGFWGAKYKYGGESPESGFDCSGLVYHVYETFGYRLERVANQQAKQGIIIAPEDMIPGDVLCFHKGSDYVGHVGIYVGNQHYIHAMGEAYGVVVTSLEDPDLQREFTVRRYVGCPELMIAPPQEWLSPSASPSPSPVIHDPE